MAILKLNRAVDILETAVIEVPDYIYAMDEDNPAFWDYLHAMAAEGKIQWRETFRDIDWTDVHYFQPSLDD